MMVGQTGYAKADAMTGPFPRRQGFTLIEMAVVVVVIAILAAIALPSYRSSMQKSRRAEGKILLQTVMAAEERFYTRANRYTSDAASVAVAMNSVPGQYYTVSKMTVSDDGQTVVTLTAAPQQAQASDSCGDLTLDSTGKRGASVADPAIAAGCW